jgi:hypothetical protein
VTELSGADESFHLPPTDDPWWTETSWYSFWVPERRLSGALYPLFRPNLGVASCSVYLWDAASDRPWQAPYARSRWHLPMPESDLTDLDLAGLRYRCVEPFGKVELAYTDAPDLAIELSWEAALPPHAIGLTATSGHFDQPGRVTGTVRLRGEEIGVDCYAMRDRSWSVRPDEGTLRAGYAYATASPDAAFHAMSLFGGEHDVVVGGYLVENGEVADVVAGTRVVEERDDDGHPVRVVLELRDARARELRAEGRCENRLGLQASPNLFAWMSLTRWRFGDGEAWGEDQDIWSPAALRAARGPG